jgi:hypothetical protein
VDSWRSGFYEIAMKEREEAIMELQEKLTKGKRRREDYLLQTHECPALRRYPCSDRGVCETCQEVKTLYRSFIC